ncbi:MAG: choice-of-anchor J domain-containing protein, partial [Bacteroidia bacterium]
MKKTILMAAGLCLGINGFAQVPYLQDFEGTNPPAGWALTNTDGTGWTFGIASAVSSSYFAPPAHTTFAIVNDDAINNTTTVSDDFMKTAVINNIPTGAYLSFDYYFEAGSTTGSGMINGPYEVFNVNISTNGGTTWSVLNAPAGITTNAWATKHVSLAAYVGMNIMLSFEYNGHATWMYGAAVDNISIAVPPATDMEYTTIAPAAGSPASYVLGGNNISISGVVNNKGLSTVTSYTVKYTDGTGVISYPKTANIATFTSGTFTISTPYNVTLGSHPIKSWVELTNDVTQTNDTLNTVLVGANFLPTHQLVVEEGTGTWCGWCPRGAVFMDSMKVVHPNDVSLIAVHDATSDPMRVAIYDAGLTALPNFTGFPTIVVDRKQLYDPSDM